MLKSSIKADYKQHSDYTPLIVDPSFTLENIYVYRIVFKYYSEEEVAFFLSTSEELSQLNFYTLNSFASLNSLSETISRFFADCWTTYVKKYIVTT